MLAVQRPIMGSSKSHMMFGCKSPPLPCTRVNSRSAQLHTDSIDSSNSLYPLPSPPPLAPGPSLLDDSDTRFLDNFFDGVSSDQYLTDPNDTWNYDWQDLPPDFLGTTSSFGQQVEPVTNDVQHLTFPEYRHPLGFIPDNPDTSSPSEDVLAAATLLQNGHNSHPTDQHGATFLGPASHSQSMGPPFPQSMVTNEPPQSRKMSTKPEDYMRHTSMNEAMYGPSLSTFSSSRSTATKKVEIQWGTDSGFTSGRRFVAPPNTLTMDEIEENIASTLECFQPMSNASTRPSSPTASKLLYSYDGREDRISDPPQDDSEDKDGKSRKRKKIKTKEGEYQGDDVNGVISKIPRKRRPKSFGTGGDPQTRDSPPLQKRRKSAASSAPKMARENLTEDQKRENHIKSEQKRRTLIKEGFEDLNELVPDLRGGGFSKSAVLIMAADWLEHLINGNMNLKAQLAELEDRIGM